MSNHSVPSIRQDSAEETLSMTGRLTPIGGITTDTEYHQHSSSEELRDRNILLEEHEKLNASLAALTRHFAHVQLRLQQVVSAPTTEDREALLLELHEFASSGIPDVMWQPSMYNDDRSQEQLIADEKRREKGFIDELKQKLDELERYAAASGSLEGAPTSVIMEKQRILIDQLRTKLDLQLDDVAVSKLSAEELRKLVDQAIFQLTNPVKLKENLIIQMRTQINDLEKFIEFLKADSGNAANSTLTTTDSSTSILNHSLPRSTASIAASFAAQNKSENASNLSQSMKKFFVLTQLYTFLFLTCGTRTMQKPQTNIPTSNPKKESASNKHFGDLRAKLEMAIEKVLNAVRTNQIVETSTETEGETSTTTTTDENEEVEAVIYDSNAVILAVRQDLSSALRALMEHGLFETSYSNTLAIWGCFSVRSNRQNYSTTSETMHVWKLFLKYYEMKHGNDFANSPARKLSQSFSLDVVGGRPITMKQCFLSGIDTVMRLHEKHTKPMDTCFKSFVCYALNEKKLVPFLRLMLRTTALIDHYYQPWSYTKQTSFNDALHSLNRLNHVDFHLPVDLSVRRFLNNRDLIE